FESDLYRQFAQRTGARERVNRRELILLLLHCFTAFLKLALLLAASPAQTGQRDGVDLRFLSLRSNVRDPRQVLTHSQPMPDALRTASNLAPCPRLWRSRRSARSSV